MRNLVTNKLKYRSAINFCLDVVTVSLGSKRVKSRCLNCLKMYSTDVLLSYRIDNCKSNIVLCEECEFCKTKLSIDTNTSLMTNRLYLRGKKMCTSKRLKYFIRDISYNKNIRGYRYDLLPYNTHKLYDHLCEWYCGRLSNGEQISLHCLEICNIILFFMVECDIIAISPAVNFDPALIYNEFIASKSTKLKVLNGVRKNLITLDYLLFERLLCYGLYFGKI